jgi:hypothetical protein
MREIRRLVFLFAGFETNAAEEQRSRFAYAAEKTGQLWNSDFDVGPLKPAPHGCPEFHVAARGAGWAAQTDVTVCDWSDLIIAVRRQNPVLRFFSGLWALAGFVLNGAFFRYLRTSWRYGLFFLYPLILILAAVLPLIFAPWGGAASIACAAVSGFLLWFFITRLHLMIMLDNWSFARALALEKDAGIEDKTALFTAILSKRIASFDAEGGGEILIAAHSLGAPFAAMALGGALAQMKPGRPAPGLLMAGSSLLKIALHPKAGRLRAAAAAIARSDVQWLDVQSLTDPLNFFKADPAAVLGLNAKRAPVLLPVRFRAMLSPETYRRIKLNWLRVHRQFVLAAERRTNYSFHMMLAGPFRFTEIMENRGLPQDFVASAQIRDSAL